MVTFLVGKKIFEHLVLIVGTPMVTFLVGKKIFVHLVLIVSLSDIISSRYRTKYANDKQFIISVIITKKLRHLGI